METKHKEVRQFKIARISKATHSTSETQIVNIENSFSHHEVIECCGSRIDGNRHRR